LTDLRRPRGTLVPMDDDTPAAGDPRRARPQRRLLAVLWSLTAAVLAVDQAAKWLAVEHLTGAAPISVVGDLLRLRLLYNSGAAFSIGTGMTWVLTLLAAVVVVVVVRASARLGSRGWAVALGLLLGGALGNLTDRVLRQPGFPSGHVVDFIAYGDWFVGNVADIAIVVAAGLVVLLGLRGIGLDGGRERLSAGPPPEGSAGA
jgi:signal peptidase II